MHHANFIYPPRQLRTGMNSFSQVNILLINKDTVSLILNPVPPLSTDVTTQVLYGGNLYSSIYQLVTSITSLQQTVTPGQNMVSINTTILSLKITGFNITISSPLIGQTNIVKLSYIAIDNLFRNLQYYVFDNYLGDNFPGALPSMSQSDDFLFNFTTKVSRSLILGTTTKYTIQPLIKGFQIINNICQQFSIGLTSSLVNSTYYSLKVNSKAQTQQYISKVYVTILAFNSTYIQIQNTLYEQFDVQFSQSLVEYSSFGSYLINVENFFIGVKQFTFVDPTNLFEFDIQTDFTNQKSLLANISPNLSTLSVLIIKVQKRSCNNISYPYFMYSNYRCYVQCPIRNYEDNTLLRCVGCNYDCYDCVNGSSCTACNSTYYFRQESIVNNILRCKAISGYYSTRANDPIAQRCDTTKCVECWSVNNNCTKCKSNEYLDVVNYTGSCNVCMNDCLECTNGLTCTKCEPLFSINSTGQCIDICTQYCSQCHIQKTPTYQSICDKCLRGFYVNQSVRQQCNSLCGDGIYIGEYEQCDDNNTMNNDGCSSQCRQQLGYNCYISNSSDPLSLTNCFYQQQVNFTLNQLIKVPNMNMFTFNLTALTVNSQVLRQLAYDKIVTIDIDYLSFIIVNQLVYYKDSISQSQIDKIVVMFQVQYTQTIKRFLSVVLDPKRNNYPNSTTTRRLLQRDSKLQSIQPISSSIARSISPPSSTTTTTSISSSSAQLSIKFTLTPQTKQSLSLISENKIAIIYQSQSLLSIASITEYMFLTISILGIIMILCSLTIYGGKIISLQYLLLCNCAYYSLVGFNNMYIFSTLKSISYLKVITLNFLFPITYSISNGNSLWWTGIDVDSFISNCLAPIVTLFIPFIIYIISVIVYKKTKSSDTIKKAQFMQKYSLGQLLMTFYLMSAYTFTVNLSLSIMTMINSTSPATNDIIGIVIGTIIFIIGMVCFIMLIKKRELFWQFISTFYKASLPQYYVNFTTLILWVNSVSLVALSALPYGNIVPIAMSIIMLVFLLKYKPYRNSNQQRRPIVIQIFNILIQGVFLLLKIKLSQSQDQVYNLPIIFHYLPLVICILLSLALIYSAYCLVHKLRQSYQDRLQYIQNQNLAKNRSLLKTLSKPLQPLSTSSQNQQTNSNQSQKFNITIQKQIIQQLKRQRGVNFLSLALNIDKKQLDQNWQQLQKVNTITKPNIDSKIQKITHIKKSILADKTLKHSLQFVKSNKLDDYFKLNLDPYQDSSIINNNNNTTQQQQRLIKTPTTNSHIKQSTPDKVSQQSPLSNKNIEMMQQSLVEQCVNCGQKISIYSNQHQLINSKYESQKYKQEWKQFFLPKQQIQNHQKHSLAQYDMI